MKKGVAFLISVAGILLIVLGVCFSFIKEDIENNIYIVQFNTNGGSLVENQQAPEGSYVLKPENPVKEGYVFSFWKYDDKEYDFDIKVTSDMTLIAAWEEVPKSQKKCTISFDTVGGERLDSIEVIETSVATLPIPKRDGYVFKNWQLNDKLYYNSILVDKDMTLVAVWEKVENNDSNLLVPDDNVVIENAKPDTNINNSTTDNKVNSSMKHVRLVDKLKVEVDCKTIKFSGYSINFSENYDKNYYYSSVDGYEILKSNVGDNKYEVIAKTSDSVYEIKNMDVSKAYYYAVRAYKNIDGKIKYSEGMKAVYVPQQLNAPKNVFYTANQNKINVTFDVNDFNVESYQILKKTLSSKEVVTSSNKAFANWEDSSYGCYTVRGYSKYGDDVVMYGFESNEVCFKPILETVNNINTSQAELSTGFDYKTTWDVLPDRPNSYILDVSRKDESGKVLFSTIEYLYDNTYFNCRFDNGEYIEIYIHGYDKTGSYELKGPATKFITR